MVREEHQPAGDPFAGAPAEFLLVAAPFFAVGLVIEVCLGAGLLDQPVAGFAHALHALLIAGAGGLMLLRARVVRDGRGGWVVLGLAAVSLAATEALGAAGEARVVPLLLVVAALASLVGPARPPRWIDALAGVLLLGALAGDGAYTQGTLVDALWPAGMLAIGAAAWQPSLEPVSAGLEGRASLAVPAVVALGAAVVLVAVPGSPATAGLALAAVAVVLVRVALALRVAARTGALGV